MSLFSSQEDHFLRNLSELAFCNPFETTRIELEKAVLGEDYVPEKLLAWSRTVAKSNKERDNVLRITERANQLVEVLRERIVKTKNIEQVEAALYDDLVTYVLYYRFVGLANKEHTPSSWKGFQAEHARLRAPLDEKFLNESAISSEHLYACLHQVRLAFRHIFDYLIGESAPATRLRSQVWQSIFTHDLRRYCRLLYRSMNDFTTLVTGPSGAGKELVARAIGYSQYQALDPKTGKFAGQGSEKGSLPTDESFLPLNLSALSPTLIESELFGHRKGAFTGADTERVGWFERCPAHGAVFLDEIGELDPLIQVKLLRVVQTRSFSRLGETELRPFKGKLIAATNRNLETEIESGNFREDLYYRLCSDRIVTPSLRDHLTDSPHAISGLIQFLTNRVLHLPANESGEEAKQLAVSVQDWIHNNLPKDYGWPGNIRELEQCVRNLLIRGDYQPAQLQNQFTENEKNRSAWLDKAEAGELTADELLNHYCQLIHQQQGGYEPAARLLGLDRRTVKSRVLQAPS